MFLFRSCCQASSLPQPVYQVTIIDPSTGASKTQKILQNLPPTILADTQTVVKKVEKSQYKDLVEAYKGKPEKWTDPEFPPSDRSLGDCQVKASKWERIQNIVPKPSLFEGKIQPKDVLQGNIGDCYFLSAVAAISEEEYRIKNVFEGQPMYNENGIYKVLLRIQGEIKEIVVDDWLPVNSLNEPIFCQLNGNEFWVAILEKAWAKAHGSYASIIAGLPNEVLRAVTHAPVYTYHLQETKTDVESVWCELLASATRNLPMCAGTVDKPELKSYGLVPGHAYTLLDAQQHLDTQGRPMRIVQLRNPWGNREWTGRLCDKDNTWGAISLQAKQKLGYSSVARDDGIFYMLYEDFLNFYDVVDICHYDSSCSYFAEGMAVAKNAAVFNLQVPEQGEYILELHQPTLRGESLDRITEGFCRATLLISEKTASGYCFTKGIMSREFADLNIRANLKPGNYVLYCKIDKTVKGSTCKQASVSVYSKAKVKLEPSTQKAHTDFLKSTFTNYARAQSDKQCITNYLWMYRKLLFKEGGFGLIVISNDAQSKKKISVSFDEAEFGKINFKLKKPYKGQGKAKLEVLPGQEIIILARSINTSASKIVFPPTMSIQMTDA